MISQLIRALVTLAAIAISALVIIEADNIKSLLPEDMNILEHLGIEENIEASTQDIEVEPTVPILPQEADIVETDTTQIE